MNIGQNIDKFKPNQAHFISKSIDEDKKIIKELADILLELRTFFMNIQDRIGLIENNLSLIGIQRFPSETQSEIIKSEQSSNNINIIDLLTERSKFFSESYYKNQVPGAALAKVRKRGILQKFVDNSDRLSKISKRRFETSKPRKYPKPAYFKLKLMRIYAKSIKYILSSDKNYNNLPSNSNDCIMFDTPFADNTLENKEELSKIPKNIKEGAKTNGLYKNLFEDSQIRLENFKRFIIEFFQNDISKIINRLGFRCCNEQEHPNECLLKWRRLRNWTFNKITGHKI